MVMVWNEYHSNMSGIRETLATGQVVKFMALFGIESWSDRHVRGTPLAKPSIRKVVIVYFHRLYAPFFLGGGGQDSCPRLATKNRLEMGKKQVKRIRGR